LSDEQVGMLLRKQGNAFMMFVQALVDNGYIAMEEVDALVSEFQQSKGYTDAQMEDLKSDDVERILPLFLPNEASAYAGVIAVAVRTFIRLIDRHAYISDISMTDSLPNTNQVNQELCGEDGIIDCFSEGCGALLKTATIFGQEDFTELDMDALDAAGEFLNCINGLYASALSQQDKFLELMPPEYMDMSAKAKNACKVTLGLDDQKLYFTVAELV
jgi:hypothetical protein